MKIKFKFKFKIKFKSHAHDIIGVAGVAFEFVLFDNCLTYWVVFFGSGQFLLYQIFTAL